MSIRAALDLGSSRHKLVVARVSRGSQHVDVLFSTAIRVPLGDALASRSDSILPRAMIAASRAATAALISAARSRGATSIAGVATAVFRKAVNGRAYLAALATELNVRIALISPSQEGALAHRAVLCSTKWPSSSRNSSSPVVWDAGGSSMQLTYLDRRSDIICVHAIPHGSASARYVFLKAGGDSKAVSAVAKWARENAGDIGKKLSEMIKGHNAEIVGVGGSGSMFTVAAQHAGRSILGVEHVKQAIEKEILSGNQLSVNVPKLVMLAELMEAFGITQIRHVFSNGSCVGLLATQSMELWGSPEETCVNTIGMEGVLLEEGALSDYRCAQEVLC